MPVKMVLWKTSLVKQILLCFDNITSLIDEGNFDDIIYFDFCKAFAVVPYDILIKKNSTIQNDCSPY